MAKTITAAEVQQGDKIRVTCIDGDRTNTAEGVADYSKQNGESPRWYTAGGWTLWTGLIDARIELLDRPNPLPVLPNAVVQYTVDFDVDAPQRTAVRQEDGTWTAYDPEGIRCDKHLSNKGFHGWLTDNSLDFDIVFGGVAK